jgi:hypothetical protein
MERLAVNKKDDTDCIQRCSISKKQYRVEVSNRFVVLEGLDTEVEINSAWEMIRET